MKYVSDEQANNEKVGQKVKELLRNHKIKEACLAVAAIHAESVFPPLLTIGIGRTPDRKSQVEEIYKFNIEIVNAIFSSNPKQLSNLSDESLDASRMYAALMQLGGSMVDEIESCEKRAAAGILITHAYIKVELARHRKSGVVKQVEILTSGDSSCEACKKIAKMRYELSEVPELPYENCTSEGGCHCGILPILYSEKELFEMGRL